MKGKLVFVTGAAVGYVLGARAGRKRYEQIRAGAEKLWNSPGVQDRVKQVQGFVDDRAPDIQSKVSEGAKKVVDQVSKRTGQRGQQRSSGNGTAASAGSGTVTTGTEQPPTAADTRPFE